jgi:outer membrane protein TolC
MVMGGMNGRDMTMPMVSVTLPVFRGKYRVQQRENALLQQAGREQYADMLNMLEAELARARSEWDNACRRVDLLRRQTVLAEAACSLATQEFASGRGDLDGVVATQRRLLDYRTRTAEAIAACNTMAATIIKLVSTEEDYE